MYDDYVNGIVENIENYIRGMLEYQNDDTIEFVCLSLMSTLLNEVQNVHKERLVVKW